MMDGPFTITLSNKVLLDYFPIVDRFAATVKLPAKAAHRVALSVRALRVFAEEAERTREKLLDEHVEKDAKGNRIVAQAKEAGTTTWRLATPTEFREAWQAVLDDHVEVTVYPFQLADVEKKMEEVEPIYLEAASALQLLKE
jgi:hypothetical protein